MGYNLRHRLAIRTVMREAAFGYPDDDVPPYPRDPGDYEDAWIDDDYVAQASDAEDEVERMEDDLLKVLEGTLEKIPNWKGEFRWKPVTGHGVEPNEDTETAEAYAKQKGWFSVHGSIYHWEVDYHAYVQKEGGDTSMQVSLEVRTPDKRDTGFEGTIEDLWSSGWLLKVIQKEELVSLELDRKGWVRGGNRQILARLAKCSKHKKDMRLDRILKGEGVWSKKIRKAWAIFDPDFSTVAVLVPGKHSDQCGLAKAIHKNVDRVAQTLIQGLQSEYDFNIQAATIRLAYENPDLRPLLLPLLKQARG
jgi:hypothetical protein